MKLLFVHQHLGEFGGAEANLILTATELRRKGHTIALAYRTGTGRNEAGWKAEFEKIYVLPLAGAVERTEAALQDFDPDLIYLHTIEDLEIIETLLRSRPPVVRMVHDHGLYCLRGYKYNYFTRKICTRAASGYCVFPCLAALGRNRHGGLPIRWNSYSRKRREIELNRQCDHFIVYSEYSRKELARNGFDPSKVDTCIPLKVWEDETLVSSFAAENLILFAGQIIRGKGVDVLLKSLSQVRNPFRCLILGDGNHRARCEALSRRLGLNERVKFQGYVLPSELRSYYLKASVFVMSSLWPEPFGLAGPEAMRYGLPVVAFDAGGIREWLQDGHNGFLVPWGDTGRFAARLDELLEDKERAKRMGRQALHSARRYDSRRQIDRLENLFQRLTCECRAADRPMPKAEDAICL